MKIDKARSQITVVAFRWQNSRLSERACAQAKLGARERPPWGLRSTRSVPRLSAG
ncbi:MAG TPA: hypothetical protein VMS38_04370 [Pseudorhodoferax sp.]|jgi:hypothetical protein|nr:hypothetical protein [Pseudorhodoferax sp.]